MDGGDGADIMEGGDDADVFIGESNDVVSGGEGGNDNDILHLTSVDHISFGGGNNEAGTVFFTDGSTMTFAEIETLQIKGAVDGTAGSDSIGAGFADSEADEVDGGDGLNDTIYGYAGNDSIEAGSGDDTNYGGDGDDSLDGGAGNDLLVGGAGNDVMAFGESGGDDIIADFDMALTAGVTADQLNVSDLRDVNGRAIQAWDVTVTDDGNGNARLGFPNGETVVLQGVSPAQASAPGALHSMGVPCFVQGCRIATPTGLRAVEDIAVGDLVVTADGCVEPVIWRGTRSLSDADLAQAPQLRPVRFAAADGFAALRVSPQHAIYLPEAGALARAVHLVDLDGVARGGLKGVVYHHLLLPQHSLLLAEGRSCESFYPGSQALGALTAADRLAVQTVIATQAYARGKHLCADIAALYGRRCAPLLTKQELARHMQAGRLTIGRLNIDRLNLPAAAVGIS